MQIITYHPSDEPAERGWKVHQLRNTMAEMPITIGPEETFN